MSKFYVWVSDNNVAGNINKTLSFDNGFMAGRQAIAKDVNTPLRQATLLTTALFEALGGGNNVDVSSTLDAVKTSLQATELFKLQNVITSNGNVKKNLVPQTAASLNLGSDANRFGAVYANYATIKDISIATLNGYNVNNIFDSSYGQTQPVVKIAAYASTDFSKGTIEERLTNLGFRSGVVTANAGVNMSYSSLRRQGNYVIGEIQSVTVDTLAHAVEAFTLPDWAIPKQMDIGMEFIIPVTVGGITSQLQLTATFKRDGHIALSGVPNIPINLNFGYDIMENL